VLAIERALDELIKAESRYSVEALSTPVDKSEFGFGQACGLFQGIRLARSILERVMNEDDEKQRRYEMTREL
jgi:hypothetical protein